VLLSLCLDWKARESFNMEERGRGRAQTSKNLSFDLYLKKDSEGRATTCHKRETLEQDCEKTTP